jgi:hypothetical protein
VSGQLIQIAYLAAASLFILGLHNLGSPKTATVTCPPPKIWSRSTCCCWSRFRMFAIS